MRQNMSRKFPRSLAALATAALLALAATPTFAANRTLTVTTNGPGSGTVTSNPAGISCMTGSTTGCSAAYAQNTVVSLTPTLSAGSTFGGWSGGCTGTGSCNVTMSGNLSVGAMFALTERMRIPGGGNFSTIQGAYGGCLSGDGVKMLNEEYAENLDCNREIDLILDGGYDPTFTNVVGHTTIRGTVTISAGSVECRAIIIS